MNFIKLTMIDGNDPVYINSDYVASLGKAYTMTPSQIAGVKPASRQVGTLVNLSNGTNHGVFETLQEVLDLLRGL